MNHTEHLQEVAASLDAGRPLIFRERLMAEVANTAREQGLSPVLAEIVEDSSNPAIARARALSRLEAALNLN